MFGFKKKWGVSLSLSRLVGISGLKNSIARKTGIPTTKGGIERKIGQKILAIILKNEKGKSNYSWFGLAHFSFIAVFI